MNTILKSIIGFLVGFIICVVVEIIIFNTISNIFNVQAIPRGLGWFVLPFITGITSFNFIYEKKKFPAINTPKIKLNIYPTTTKNFRIAIILSIFWIIGVLLATIINGCCKWFFDKEMYQFIFIGFFPPALFWSYYWVKSAKD